MMWYLHESRYFSAHWVSGRQLWGHSKASCSAIHSFFLLSIYRVLCIEATARNKTENDLLHGANAKKAKNKSMQISRFNNSRR